MIRILLSIVMGITLASCDGSHESSSKPDTASASPAINLPTSAIAVATVREVHPSFEYPAVVEAQQLARVRAEVSAVLKKVHFTPGQMVEKGQLLLEFDPSQYKAAYDAASAELLSAEAAAAQSSANWDRAEELLPKGYISQKDYDKAKAAVDGSFAAVARARAGVEKAELDLSHTSLMAPFTGKISKSYYSVGDYIVANSPTQPEPLFELVQLDPIYVVSSVDLEQYHKFVLVRKELESRGVEIPQLITRLKLAGGVPYPQEGTFEAWDNTSTASSGTMSGRLLFPNPESLLLPGHNVVIMGETLASFHRILIPQKAVMQDQQGYFVKVLNQESQVERRNVDLGIRYEDKWIVLEGLEEGAQVITTGAQMLREGAKVVLQEQ